jgi:hypothetical protein
MVSKCCTLMGQYACLLDKDYTAGLSRNRYVCSRTLATPPRQTSGQKVIAVTSTTPADNKITVCERHFKKLESLALGAPHFREMPSVRVCGFESIKTTFLEAVVSL